MHFTTKNTTPKANITNEYSLISMYCIWHQLIITKLSAISKEWRNFPKYSYDGDNTLAWRHHLQPFMTMTTSTMIHCHADRIMVNKGVYDVEDK